MRFKKLLVALDFSEPSRKALHSAAQMAADNGAEMVLVHVWQPTASLTGGPEFPISFAEDYIQQAKDGLEDSKREAEQMARAGSGARRSVPRLSNSRLRRGEPARSCEEYAWRISVVHRMKDAVWQFFNSSVAGTDVAAIDNVSERADSHTIQRTNR